MNQDVLTGSLGNSQSLNRYSYAQGNPVSYTDPFGLSPLSGMFNGATFAHLLFGLLGFVPGPIGVTANLADAVLYAFEGDYLMATASLLGAATMGFSKIATKCAVQAAKAAKAADIAKQMSLLQKAQKAGFVADLSRTAGNSLYLARSYGQARQIVNKESGLAGTARPGEAYSWEEKLALAEALAACALSAFGMVSGGMGTSRAANELRALNGAGANADIASKSGSNTVKDGASRAAQYSSGWSNASLQEAIDKFAPNVEPVVMPNGKIIYNNQETGISVVYDKKGNYFRIEDTTRPRGRNYLDLDGNDMNNEIVNGKTRGRSKADYQRVTHFNNSDN